MKKYYILSIVLFIFTFMSHATSFQEGIHYEQVGTQTKVKEKSVIEFFSVFCPHCYSFEKRYLPIIKKNLNKDIKFKQYHVNFINSTYAPRITKAIAVSELLQISKNIKQSLYITLHEKKQSITNDAQVFALFEQYGITKEEYEKANHSFLINIKTTEWENKRKDFNIQATPQFVVNEKYLVDTGSVNSVEELAELFNYLANK